MAPSKKDYDCEQQMLFKISKIRMLSIQKLIKSLSNVPVKEFFLHKVSDTHSANLLEHEHRHRHTKTFLTLE